MTTMDYVKLGHLRAERTRKARQGIYTPPVTETYKVSKQLQTHMIKGTPEQANTQLKQFFTDMQFKYKDFEIVKINTVDVPIGVVIYITYTV